MKSRATIQKKEDNFKGESEMDSGIYSSGGRGETTPGTSVLREGRFKMTGRHSQMGNIS